MSTTPKWVLPRHLRVSDIDAWLTTVLEAGRGDLHLGQHGTAADPMGAAHLQAALCLLARKGIECSLSVPENTLAGERAGAAFSVADTPKQITPAESVLATTLEGLILGQLCQLQPTAHLDSETLRKWQRNSLKGNSYHYGHGRNRAIAIPTIGDRREHNTAISSRVRNVEASIARLVRGVNSDPAPWAKWWFDLVFSFVFEAMENTFDHGRYDLNRNPIPSLRILDLARHNLTEVQPRVVADSSSGQQTVLDDYLDRLQRHYAIQRRKLNVSKLVEITVADGGLGMVGTMARGLAPYEEIETTAELEFLATALLPRGTSKSAGEIGVGHGVRKMLRACHGLRGMFVLRTGRFELSRTFLDERGRPGQFDFLDGRDAAFDVDQHVSQRQMVAGTTWTIIFPMDDALIGRAEGEGTGQELALAGSRR
ncbi:hypothetical protein [Antrihabitans sp. YC2-6]|uniref:hypothetical protein n=1 Tax=Antrihabitans sp. YC2-6 TaxID=2799498 RepID=UPI0018F52512|nr:hypothetical protein [Antrihabitans sp. YC2-6]MBJ8347611.1 hypothetical protein [Antrihabitans sp. YC2-6]